MKGKVPILCFREIEEGGRRLFPHFPADMRLIKKNS